MIDVIGIAFLISAVLCHYGSLHYAKKAENIMGKPSTKYKKRATYFDAAFLFFVSFVIGSLGVL